MGIWDSNTYYNMNGIWALNPYDLGPWTLRLTVDRTFSATFSLAEFSTSEARAPKRIELSDSPALSTCGDTAISTFKRTNMERAFGNHLPLIQWYLTTGIHCHGGEGGHD